MEQDIEVEVKKAEEKENEPEWEGRMKGTMKGIKRDFGRMAHNFPTPEFRKHTRAARREMLLAFRSLIDEAINRLEEKDRPKPEEPKAGRVTLE